MNDDSLHPRPTRGRPTAAPATARRNRIVSFVTDHERELLDKVCQEEERSMAFVVHRIIKSHFE